MNARKYSDEEVLKVFEECHGSNRDTAKQLGIARSTVRRRMAKMGKLKRPLFHKGSVQGTEAQGAELPAPGVIKRYIVTSAQNNTAVHAKVWKSLQALAKFYNAEILVGTYSYNQNAYGPLAVKNGTFKGYDRKLWYAPEVMPFISDQRRELASGLVWCGEMNILPTAIDPLSGLESYTARQSAIFPHAKLAMRSIATMQSEGTKMNYTTGTVTRRNYIKKRAGLIAEHHHVYGGLLVEVNAEGNWWVRQLNAENDGTLYDLDVCVHPDGVVTNCNSVEAITWGDLHSTMLDERVKLQAMDMLDTLRPRQQFIHDVLEGLSINHHLWKNAHAKFKAHVRGLDDFLEELRRSRDTIKCYLRDGTKTIVVYSNHDSPWVLRWLQEHDYRNDPKNAIVFLETQLAVYRAIDVGDERFNALEYLMRHIGLTKEVLWLRLDESYTICNKRIECGMHGHLGPNGSKGSPSNLQTMGRKANIGHTHSAGIFNGLYVSGTSTKLLWDYAKGPSSWTQSHIITYPNGKRAIITMYNGNWRAV